MVSRDGILPLKKISEFCNHSSITRKHINVPLNPQGETIGFFLADVGLNIGNIGEFKALLDGLKTKGYDFNHKNEFGQTLLDKAKDAENEFLVEYLTNIGRKK